MGSLPWELPPQLREGKDLFYRVVLGSMLMKPVTEALVREYGYDEARTDFEKKRAIAAEILIDDKGVPLLDKGIAVSSFTWALPLALDRKVDELGSWSTAEQELQSGIAAIVQRVDAGNKQLPLDAPTLDKACRWLVEQCRIPHGLMEQPTFVLRHYQRAEPAKTKTPPESISGTTKKSPEPLFLNSFLLQDLPRAARHLEKGTAAAGLLQYLGAGGARTFQDVLRDDALLEKAVAPGLFPAAKWPSGKGRSLVMLQQAAVNLARKELGGKQGCSPSMAHPEQARPLCSAMWSRCAFWTALR